MRADIFSKEELFSLHSMINYWTNACTLNASEKKVLPSTEKGHYIMNKINYIIEERHFFEEWNIYEKDIPTDFLVTELSTLACYLNKTLMSWEQHDPDIMALFNVEEIYGLKTKLAPYCITTSSS